LTWFCENGQDEQLFKYDNATQYYPQYLQSEAWNPNQAYYMLMVDPEAWTYTDHVVYPLAESDYTIPAPSNAWEAINGAQWENPLFEPLGEYWYFISYPVPGYTKIATIYDDPLHPSGSLSGQDTYRGPFHWLIWNQANPSQHRSQMEPAQQYLTIVRTDDGKHYIPYLPGRIPREIDQIGVLEPGRGYFMGFLSNATIPFDGWNAYPGWPTQGLPPDPNSPLPMIASAGHFQFKKYTHWSYPVVIDTVAIEGLELETGDEFGFFTPAGLCVGAQAYNGEFPVVVTTWADDIATPDTVDGYHNDDEMIIKLYDVSENAELILDLGPETQAVENTVAPLSGGYGRGSFAIRSLIYGVQSVQQLPQAYKLGQNYPNPFNAETVIPLELPQRSQVRIELFNVQGRNAGVIFDGEQNAGWPKIRWNAAKLPSGVYFYRINAKGLERAGGHLAVGKMLVLK
jgi:hypothetical protein